MMSEVTIPIIDANNPKISTKNQRIDVEMTAEITPVNAYFMKLTFKNVLLRDPTVYLPTPIYLNPFSSISLGS